MGTDSDGRNPSAFGFPRTPPIARGHIAWHLAEDAGLGGKPEEGDDITSRALSELGSGVSVTVLALSESLSRQGRVSTVVERMRKAGIVEGRCRIG